MHIVRHTRTATTGDDQREQDDTENDDDLECGQPELELAEELDASKVVDANNHDQEYGDEDTGIECVARDPVLNNQGGGRELIRGDDDVLEPIAGRNEPFCGFWEINSEQGTHVQPRAKPREGWQ